MNRKNIFLNILFILLASSFNVLYKYITVNENMYRYNLSSSFGISFITSSKVEPPYVKIFLLSLMCFIFIYGFLIYVLYYLNKKNLSKMDIFNKLSNLFPLIVAIIIGILLIFINIIYSFICVSIGVFIYLFLTYKEFSNKKNLFFIILFIVIMIYILYFISS